MATQPEQSEILPPPAEETQLTLPLTFFNLPWLYVHPIQRLLFYKFPCSKAYFLETIFYPFLPQLPPPKEEAEYKTFRVLCLQVTLFPNRGVCIGFTNHHTIGDASSIVGFIKAWTSISKLGGDSQLIEAKFLPLFDRSVIKDPSGIVDVYWSQIKNFKLLSSSLNLPTSKVRATYIFHHADMKKLKDSVSAQKPDLVQPSSFVITTAYVWTCLEKSGPASGEEPRRSMQMSPNISVL
ncbi:HXXXD-type acyl-transferase family protein [Forsythia ovata]|uniref:HXXXD-type acyl-transferase family protein n=1 Tax=Forsythia ovata TaxID=205694 RepID=A0ABD1S867_9LAMI